MARLARRATRLTTVAAALTTGIALAPAAHAGEQELNAVFTDEVIGGTLRFDGGTARLLDLRSITRTVDGLGRTLTAPRTVALRPGSGPKLANYSCLPRNQGDKNFRQFEPVEIFNADRDGKVQALFHVYRQAKARKAGHERAAKSVQFEVCGVGGSDPDGLSRTRKIGLGIAYADKDFTYKIGQAWKNGSTTANLHLNLAFKIPVKGVEIGGSISQNPTHKLMGSISTPIPSPVDVYARNAVNAWWQDGCVGSWHGCRFFHGSQDFHGAVVHGLWEFTPQEAEVVDETGFAINVFRSAI